MRHKARDNRRKEQRQEQERAIKDKFQDIRREQVAAQAITPLNDRQAEYMNAIRTKDLVIATGYAGTSKTFVATCMAADAFRLNECKRIVLARPAVSNSQSLGFFSGDANEKMTNWLMPMLSVLYKRLGKAVVDIAIMEGNIVLQPLETIKGMSFGKDTWVIADEVQDCEIEEIKSIATRSGGCKMILCGDIRQSALAGDSGLRIFADIVANNHRLQESVALIDFDEHEHIVRSRLCRELIIAFDKSGY
jgi:phosphate starvation-inducible PhoH-like protein